MDIEKLIYSECHNPIQVKVYNGIKNCYEYKQVPCGKCFHCKMTKINEWVTRMVAESNYHKYVYFGTLTYNGKHPSILLKDNFSFMSKNNHNKSNNLTPLVLRRDHIQKFFKRLRKNTGVKFQVAYCGEYGYKYSRPHYHYILWCDKPISQMQVYRAWSAPSLDDPKKLVVIGKTEHRDIKNNGYAIEGDKDNTAAFKYVCKYIQKCDFKFNELKTIKHHEKTFKKEFDNIYCNTTHQYYYTNENMDKYLMDKNILSWDDYKKVFSPFFGCSKKPAIGLHYLQDNLREFQKGCFKLYGLPSNYIFPLYFIRKTKESLCPLKAQSETNSSTTSASRLPKMVSLISHIETAQLIAENTNQIVQLFQYNNNVYTLESRDNIQDIEQLYDNKDKQPQRINHYRFKREYLGFTNHETNVRYSFRGDYFAMYNNTTDDYLGTETLENVKNQIIYYYERLKYLLTLFNIQSEISTNKKAALIEEYGGIEQYKTAKKLALQNFNNKIKFRQDQYKQTKQNLD